MKNPLNPLNEVLPATGYKRRGKPITHDGVVADLDRKPLDRFADERYETDANIELGLRLAHCALTQRGDDVVIIGGGNGISAVTAAYHTGYQGSVTIYDALTGENTWRFGVSHIRKGLELNGVDHISEVRHGIVGTDRHIVDKYQQYIDYHIPLIHPSDLPECDVLEFDCNGMELDILRDLDIRPRAMIVEIEAPFYGEMFGGEERPEYVLEELKDLGYAIIQRTGHEGIHLSHEELLELLTIQFQQGEKDELPNGAKHSPIVYALNKEWIQEEE